MVVRYGEGGIRTPDRGISPYNGLANRRLQPLGHLSSLWPNNLAARRLLWKGGLCRNCANCDWVFNSDHSECVVYDGYRDSDALLEHLANLGDTMDALLRVCSISGEILGTPSAELGKALEGADVQVYTPYQSM